MGVSGAGGWGLLRLRGGGVDGEGLRGGWEGITIAMELRRERNSRRSGAVDEMHGFGKFSSGRESCQPARPPSHDWASAETVGEVNKDEWLQSQFSHFSPQGK